MKQRTRIILGVYSVGVAIIELLLLWNAYHNGGFQRPHTLTDLAIVAGLHMAVGLLWPIVTVVAVLQYFGLLPHSITF